MADKIKLVVHKQQNNRIIAFHYFGTYADQVTQRLALGPTTEKRVTKEDFDLTARLKAFAGFERMMLRLSERPEGNAAGQSDVTALSLRGMAKVERTIMTVQKGM